MLNELYSMSQSLSRCGLKVMTRHKDLKKNRKTDGFILGIAEDGRVSSIEFCGKDRMEALWKIDSGENGVSFPGFKISGPLWSVNGENQEVIDQIIKLKKEAVAERSNLIESLLEGATFNYDLPDNKQKHYVKKNLRDFPRKIAPVFADPPPDYKILSDLLKRLTESSLSEENFLKSLSTALLTALQQGKLLAVAALLIQNFLLGKWEDKERKFGKSELTVILEPAGGIKYPFAITHPRTEEFVNEQMNLQMTGKVFTTGGKGAKSRRGIDSLCGLETEIQTRFPDPILPEIKKTILMSMSSESRCQTRYGLQESAIFPVGKKTTQALLDALIFLTKEERKGKTWHGVPNSEGKKDLLIVYLEDKPDAAVNLADFFALDANDAVSAEAQFEATAEKVCAALDGDPAISPDSLLRVIVLSSRDQGRQQIALSECFQVKDIFQAAAEWRQAGNNLPSVYVLLQPKKGEKLQRLSPSCLHPATLLKCFNTQWTNEGMRSCPVSSCDMGEIYEIFLRQSARSEATAERLLTLALQRNNGLLLALGNRLHGNNWSGFLDRSRFAALLSVSAVGILLFKTGHQKEEFMKQAPFNIGRLLSLADQLHALYCKEMRSGDVPPQLFGNALMNTALQQPITAVALFAQRVLPYQAWANTAQSKNSDDEEKRKRIGLAKYYLKELGIISHAINESTIPTTLNDTQRAEMILGYLASNKESQQPSSQGEQK
jgi:hypothetical protein